jgi:hypothetical protein
MSPNHTRRPARAGLLAVLALVAVLALFATACSSDSKATATTTTAAAGATTTTASKFTGKLVGTFKVTAAVCTAAGAPTAGSYFRMVQSAGSLTAGPFVSNADSICAEKTYSGLIPGSDGGLITGAYQSQPANPFDATKNGVAAKIVEPTKFFAVGFALSTNDKDPTSGKAVPAPSITADANGKLTGDLRALNVAWNGQQFNQGAPKADGGSPGLTTAASGTIDPKTGAFTLEWASQVVGGPFNGFTGVWRLTGTFTPAS